MNDVGRTLKHLVFLYLLLAINILPTAEIIPPVFPFTNISSVYLLFLSAGLILRYYLRVAEQDKLKTVMLWLAGMIFFLILLRCMKYSVFGAESVAGRFVWYLYYVPVMLISLFLFYVSGCVFTEDEPEIKRRQGWATGITIVFILLILTNDLHQLVFRFAPEFVNWDGEYSYGGIYYAAVSWQFLLYAAAITKLLVRSAVAGILRRAWLILIPFTIGIGMMLLLAAGVMPKLNGTNIIEFPEILCFMAAGVMECCMQLGLIPTNENYQKLMHITSVPVQITDQRGKAIYKSDAATELTVEQFRAPDGARVGEHMILRKMSLSGGFGFWQVDVSELDRLSGELAEVKTRISEETELIRLQNELKERQVRIEQRTAVYGKISESVQKQVMLISQMAQQALAAVDTELRDRYRIHIVLLAAYIKRYSNLVLLSSESGTVDAGDLALSVAEFLRYLNHYGIPSELVNTADGAVPAEKALAVFEALGTLIEEHLSVIKGVYVNFSRREDGLILKLTLENVQADDLERIREKIFLKGVQTFSELEDDTGYYQFVFGKEKPGNDAVL